MRENKKCVFLFLLLPFICRINSNWFRTIYLDFHQLTPEYISRIIYIWPYTLYMCLLVNNFWNIYWCPLTRRPFLKPTWLFASHLSLPLWMSSLLEAFLVSSAATNSRHNTSILLCVPAASYAQGSSIFLLCISLPY